MGEAAATGDVASTHSYTKIWYNCRNEDALCHATHPSHSETISSVSAILQVEEGRYGSASDVVCAGLRLLEAPEAKVKALQDALIAGEHSGEPARFDFDAFIGHKLTEARAR